MKSKEIRIFIEIVLYFTCGAATMAHSDNAYPIKSKCEECGQMASFSEAIVWPLYWAYYLTDKVMQEPTHDR